MKLQDLNKCLIGGIWREGNSETVYTVTNPFNDEPLAQIRLANQDDIDQAYQAAQAAQPMWAKHSAAERTEVINKVMHLLEEKREEIVEVIVRETGGTYLKANIEINLALDVLQASTAFPPKMDEVMNVSSHIPGKENRIYRLPVGVVAVITPWNFPLILSMRSVAPALAAGNSVVLKPDLQTPMSGGLIIAQLFEEAGLPPGVLSVIVADIAEIKDSFVEHPIPSVISFTGSTAVGRHIGKIAGEKLKNVSLELGGNNAFIVLDDADIDQAVSAAIFGKFMHQGQICMAINRLIVDRKIYEEFTIKFKEKAMQLKVGDQREKDTCIGPLINEKQVAKIVEGINQSIAEGAKVILEGNIEGNMIEPIILIDVKNEMTIAQQEIFGPVALIIPVDGEEEAIEVANATPYGLSGSVHSRDIDRAIRVAQQIKTGMIHVNDQTVNDEANIAFGGEKASGIGRFGGEWVLDAFTTLKWISIQNEPRQYPFS